jgi:hypothetical protein
MYTMKATFSCDEERDLHHASEYNASQPVARLSSDLLLAIFTRCDLSIPFTTLYASEPPSTFLSFSQVCRDWRALALNSPLLWTTPQLLVPELTDLALRRSGNTLLHIVLDLRSVAQTFVLVDLPQHIQRVYRLVLVGPIGAMTALARRLASQKPDQILPELTLLSLHVHDGGQVIAQSATLSLPFLVQAINLREIRVFDMTLDWAAITSTQLTSISLGFYMGNPITMPAFLQILARFANLQRLHLVDIFPRMDISELTVSHKDIKPRQAQIIVTLQHLRTAQITGYDCAPLALLSCLRFPQTAHVDIEINMYFMVWGNPRPVVELPFPILAEVLCLHLQAQSAHTEGRPVGPYALRTAYLDNTLHLDVASWIPERMDNAFGNKALDPNYRSPLSLCTKIPTADSQAKLDVVYTTIGGCLNLENLFTLTIHVDYPQAKLGSHTGPTSRTNGDSIRSILKHARQLRQLFLMSFAVLPWMSVLHSMALVPPGRYNYDDGIQQGSELTPPFISVLVLGRAYMSATVIDTHKTLHDLLLEYANYRAGTVAASGPSTSKDSIFPEINCFELRLEGCLHSWNEHTGHVLAQPVSLQAGRLVDMSVEVSELEDDIIYWERQIHNVDSERRYHVYV